MRTLLAEWSKGHAAGGIVIASHGLHYNLPIQSHSVFRNYTHDLHELFDTMDEFRASCTRCSASFLTATFQHFPSIDGTFSTMPSTRHSENISSNPCRPFNSTMVDHHSANHWRVSMALEVSRLHPDVLVIPMHALSQWWLDAHVGAVTNVIDCTHFCFSPFLYEPIFLAVSIAAQSMKLGASSSSPRQRGSAA